MNSGFYKNDNGQLLYGPNFVLNKDYELKKENKDNYEYPVDGWYWFESETDARVYFNMTINDQDSLTNNDYNEFI
jgi:hypothetical protein